MRKILFCDIDGTVLGGEQLFSLRDWQALRKLHESDNLLVFCTSRNGQEAHDILRKFKLPYDYLILNNGAHIEDKQGTVLFSRTISWSDGMEILKYCTKFEGYYVYFYDSLRKLGCGISIGTANGENDNRRISEYDNFILEAVKAESFDMIGIKFPGKMLPASKLVSVASTINEVFGEKVSVSLNALSLAVTPKYQSKGSGIKRLLSMMDDFEIYSIGDSSNDISMFSKSDHSFTFFRCEELIKKYADRYVDYVYEVIEEILMSS